MRWTVVIPTKALPAAKSRLAPASPDADAHRRLVEAVRADTIAAARASDQVARIVIVTDRETVPADDAYLIVQTRPGLNGALLDAAEYATRRWPDDGVAALVGDLPALRASELSEALSAGAAQGGFVADAAGTGTTLLAAAAGSPLQPRFGLGSAARHSGDVTALEAGPGLRHDVDTPADLRAAAELGLGQATSAVLAVGDYLLDTTVTTDVRSSCLGSMRP